jgi:hypothetical protein
MKRSDDEKKGWKQKRLHQTTSISDANEKIKSMQFSDANQSTPIGDHKPGGAPSSLQRKKGGRRAAPSRGKVQL